MMRRSMLVKQRERSLTPPAEDDVQLPPVPREVEASCSFIHGNAVLLEMSRHDFEDTVHTGVFRLSQQSKNM